MKLETHAKIGIWVGIVALVISMSFFTLHESQELKYQYGRLFVDPDQMYEKLATTGTADAFIEKFPYFYEDFDIRRDGSSRLELFSINNQTGNRIELSIRYDQDDDKIRERINCQYSRQYEMIREQLTRAAAPEASYAMSGSMFLDGNARDQFVKDFIKITDCLDDPEKMSENVSDGRFLGGPMMEPEPIPEPSR